MSTFAARRYAEVGSRIRAAREKTGLSQERFAPVIGITRRHLIRLENGEHHPSPELRERLAEHTGEPAEHFSLDDDSEAVRMTSASAEFHRALDAMFAEAVKKAVAGEASA